MKVRTAGAALTVALLLSGCLSSPVKFTSGERRSLTAAEKSIVADWNKKLATNSTRLSRVGVNTEETANWHLRKNETLEQAVRRWAWIAGYDNVSWEADDYIPITFDLTLVDISFIDALNQLAQAYGKAPEPIFFDITLNSLQSLMDVRVLQPEEKRGFHPITVEHSIRVSTERVSRTQPEKTIAAVSDSSVISNPVADEIWRLGDGEYLESEVRRWAEHAGYSKVIWNAGFHIRIEQSVELKGTFIEALNSLKEAYGHSEDPIGLDFTPHKVNKVLVVNVQG